MKLVCKKKYSLFTLKYNNMFKFITRFKITYFLSLSGTLSSFFVPLQPSCQLFYEQRYSSRAAAARKEHPPKHVTIYSTEGAPAACRILQKSCRQRRYSECNFKVKHWRLCGALSLRELRMFVLGEFSQDNNKNINHMVKDLDSAKTNFAPP